MGAAILHVIGALGASVAFWVFVIAVAAWETEKVKKRRLQDAAMVMGVSVHALENDETLGPRLLKYSSERASGELLRNRFSDLCGWVRTGWGWLGSVIQICIVVGVFWAMFSDGSSNAPIMWAAPAVSVFFWVSSLAFSYACLLLTGRYPGEASAMRKSIAAFVETQGPPHDAASPAGWRA